MPMIPGLGDGTGDIPGMDPALAPDVGPAFAAAQAADQFHSAQRAAQFSDLDEHLVDVVQEVLTKAMEGVLTEMLDVPGGPAQIRRLSALLNGPGGPTGAPGQSSGGVQNAPTNTDAEQGQTPPEAPSAPPRQQTSSRPPTFRETYTEGGSPEEGGGDEEDTRTLRQRFMEGRGMVQGRKMGDIIQEVARPLNRRLSETGHNWELTTDPDTGEQTYQRITEMGETVTVPESDTRAFRNVGLGMALRNNVSRIAAGEGAAAGLGRLGAFAGRVAGPVGVVVGGVIAAGHAAEAQNRAAATYRSAFGQEDTGGAAAQDRIGEFMAGLEGFGSIGGDMAREQYQAASGAGLRGQQRGQATDFMRNMFLDYGMDTSDSMQFVERTARDSRLSLSSFADAIKDVSEAAVAAGRNSSEAIKEFADAQSYIASNVVGGQASTTLARGMTTGVTRQMDPTLVAAMGGTRGMAQLLSPTNAMNLAALSGQDPMAIQSALTDPTRAPQAGMDLLASFGDQILRTVAGVAGKSPDEVRSQIRSLSGGRTPSDAEQHAILVQVVGGDQQMGVLLSSVQGVMQSIVPGFNVDRGQLVALIYRSCTGGWRDVARTGSQSDQRKAPSLSATPRNWAGSEGWTGSRTEAGGGWAPSLPQALQNPYDRSVSKGGQRSGIIESILNDPKSIAGIEEASKTSLEDSKFRIRTGSGSKTVGFDQLLSSRYREQVESGDVDIVNSRNTRATPTSLRQVVQVEFKGQAADWIRQANGPSEEQRSGLPGQALTWIYGE